MRADQILNLVLITYDQLITSVSMIELEVILRKLIRVKINTPMRS